MKMQPELPKEDMLLKRKPENFVSAVLTKVKGFWKSKSASTGIQFFVEMDD
jgi:hypothetical protein